MTHPGPPPYSNIRIRSPETEAVRQLHPQRSRLPEPCDYEYECARKKLSEFNESLPRRPLTCVKYEWANLMLDKQENSDSGLSPGGSEAHNVESLCHEQNPSFLSKRYHLGVNGIEVSCYKQEKKPVLDSNEDTRRTIQSMDCVTTNASSSISLKEYFDTIYGDVRVNDLRSVDLIIDKTEVDHACREGEMLDHHGGNEDGEYSGHSRGSRDMEIVGEHSGSIGFVVEHGLQVNVDYASVQAGDDYGFEREGDLGSYEQVLMRLPNSEFDQVLYEKKDGNQEILEAEEELGIQELSRNRISYDDAYDLSNVGAQCSAEDLEQLSVSKDSAGPMQEPTDQVVKPSSFDINKPFRGHSGRRCRPLTRRYNKNIKKPLLTTNLDDFNDDVRGDDLLMEPLEDSQPFKQLVQNAFLKYVQPLYEIPALQTKFRKQEGSTTLSCIVCCSKSREFKSTHSLLQHAFMCRTTGLRAAHLGFHKAVCVLTGWNYEATPNGSWVQQTLSDAEALAVKEDLIIWPPAVFVHNSSIANANPQEQITVSIEKLKAVIKGMGFDRGMTKVCRGKAANQSIMVVNFHGTLSGLQEAEKFHKHFAENKHGRYEFQQIASRGNCTSDGSQKKDKIECFLYGYLGIIEDLHKLNFMAKKRCVMKSKKEIQAIAGGPS